MLKDKMIENRVIFYDFFSVVFELSKVCAGRMQCPLKSLLHITSILHICIYIKFINCFASLTIKLYITALLQHITDYAAKSWSFS